MQIESRRLVFRSFNIDDLHRFVAIQTDPEVWMQFAEDNGASELVTQSIIGESIWSYIEGMEVRHLYEFVFEKIRASGKK